MHHALRRVLSAVNRLVPSGSTVSCGSSARLQTMGVPMWRVLIAVVGADMILIGTHGRSALGGLFLGSVAQRVVHLAAVPVLLVK
jgi:nucleotide-binding universal stress UspA family protein